MFLQPVSKFSKFLFRKHILINSL
jgi:molecular chaperone DnaJ